MIRKVVLRRFKRFEEVTFEIPGHVVLAGPNNAGKTTLLQAIAAWSVAYRRWLELNDFNPRQGYVRAPIARQAFSAVPLRSFDFLWNNKVRGQPIEIEIEHSSGWRATMEFLFDSTEQMYVRPRHDVDRRQMELGDISLLPVYVPAMTGLSTEEPVYTRPKQDQLLGQGKPGEILRNLLVEANQTGALAKIQDSIRTLFGCELIPPNADGPNIVAEYRALAQGVQLDIASAGSGFQQVVMLLSFLHTRPGSVLLLDEPDAHLHVILQDAIYGELRRVAVATNSQLIIATHSEVIINSVEPQELCVMYGAPRLLSTTVERQQLARSLGVLTHNDAALALNAPGIVYLEGHTDLSILREFARILGHPAYETLTTRLFWKPTVWEPRPGGTGIKARDHFAAIQLVRADLPGVILLDGDDDPNVKQGDINGQGLQRLRWRRYEIESYLVHPEVLARFVAKAVGEGAAKLPIQEMRSYMERTFTGGFMESPLGEHPLVEAYLSQRKARTEVLPPILDAAGLQGFDYTRYFEIAAVMNPDEIHPEVREKLDLIQKAFRL